MSIFDTFFTLIYTLRVFQCVVQGTRWRASVDANGKSWRQQLLKEKVNNLFVTKEENEILKKDVEYIKEEINILRAANKETADKISQIENYFEYETEDESETCNTELQSSNNDQFNNNKENESCEYDEDLFQKELVNKEVLYVCNIYNKGFDTESEVTKHLTKN